MAVHLGHNDRLKFKELLSEAFIRVNAESSQLHVFVGFNVSAHLLRHHVSYD